MSQGKIVKVAGPLIVAENMRDANMSDVVRVGKQRLIGEIIEMREDKASIQVYEETAGIGPGDMVESTGAPLSVELAPGVLTSIFDGIQRPLTGIYQKAGDRITRGIEVTALDHAKQWEFKAQAKPGDRVEPGDVLGCVQETAVVEHRIMVPVGLCGTVKTIGDKTATLEDTIAQIETDDGKIVPVTMLQRWPVRRGRPYREKQAPKAPATNDRLLHVLQNLRCAAFQNALAVRRIERHALGKSRFDGISQLSFRESRDGNQHILKFEITVIALDGFVDERPDFFRTVLCRRAQPTQEAHRSKAGRTALLVEQCRLSARNRLVASPRVHRNKLRQCIQALPARLRLRSIERIHEGIRPVGNKLGVLARNHGQDRRGKLPRPTGRPFKVLE